MTRLEDYLLPMNLIKKREEFIQEIDAIIDDGGITNVPLTFDEIAELESRNYPNVGYDEMNLDNYEKIISSDEFSRQIDGWVVHDEEHFVDHETEMWHEVESKFAEEFNSEMLKEIQKLAEEKESTELPLYLLNDSEIVGYPDKETQTEIYAWVNSKLPSHNFSIKDLGCGRGDFGHHLDYSIIYDEDGPTQKMDYFGIDNNPNLIQVGLQKYPGINLTTCDFNEISIFTDYTICIGTLNDDHGFDKWDYFNKTLNHALNNTKTAVLFVLQADCYGEDGHLDYPIHELIENLPSGTRYEIDNSKFEDIYLLTVHIGGFN